MSEEAGAQRWRKKPVVVEAKQWLKHGDHSAVRPYETAKGWIETLEGGHIVNPGDWIITGVKGEHYPCKPDIFAQTYEPVEAEVTQLADDDARLAEIRQWVRAMRAAYPDRDAVSLCQGMVEDLLRLLDEAHADERKKLVAMLRDPSADLCDDIRETCYQNGYMSLRPVLQRLADLLERAP